MPERAKGGTPLREEKFIQEDRDMKKSMEPVVIEVVNQGGGGGDPVTR